MLGGHVALVLIRAGNVEALRAVARRDVAEVNQPEPSHSVGGVLDGEGSTETAAA
jgi:hypothetical protein